MIKYQIKYIYPNGNEEIEDELYDTEDEARDAAEYGCSCYMTGGEILHLSNPGDYDEPEEYPDYEIIEVKVND